VSPVRRSHLCLVGVSGLCGVVARWDSEVSVLGGPSRDLEDELA
jgi:hypothetical protein